MTNQYSPRLNPGQIPDDFSRQHRLKVVVEKPVDRYRRMLRSLFRVPQPRGCVAVLFPDAAAGLRSRSLDLAWGIDMSSALHPQEPGFFSLAYCLSTC
jgi:hypothetical protein